MPVLSAALIFLTNQDWRQIVPFAAVTSMRFPSYSQNQRFIDLTDLTVLTLMDNFVIKITVPFLFFSKIHPIFSFTGK